MEVIEKQNVIWGILLIVFGLTALVDVLFNISAWGWVLILILAGVFSGAVNFQSRDNLANFIPTYVLWAIAGMVAFTTLNLIRDEAVAVYVLWVIGFPFVVGFWRDRSQWGFLIPAYVLFSVGLMVGLIGIGLIDDLLIPAYVMFAISIPFLFVYLRDRKNWWALIPGGIMTTIGLGFLLATPAVRLIVPIAFIILGGWILARTFISGKS